MIGEREMKRSTRQMSIVLSCSSIMHLGLFPCPFSNSAYRVHDTLAAHAHVEERRPEHVAGIIGSHFHIIKAQGLKGRRGGKMKRVEKERVREMMERERKRERERESTN